MIENLAKILSEVSEQSFFVKFSPEVFDFTDKNLNPEIQIFTKTSNFQISIVQNLELVISLFKCTVFGKDKKVVVWDWKNLASYLKFKTGRSFQIDGTIIDLKILESCAGLRKNSPASLLEALNRLKNLIADGTWKEVETVYKNLHLPLATQVIPAIETTGVLDDFLNQKVYPNYEIARQENGRLNCAKLFYFGFVPQALNKDTKVHLRPRSQEEYFLLFDYKANEVFMLAWLSKDPLLLEICQSPDVYATIWQKVLDKPQPEKSDRDLAKKTFLPLIYGKSIAAVGQALGCDLTTAENIVHKIKSLFPLVFTFIEGYQKQAENHGYAKDIFGKRRYFEPGKEYLARNFSIQSPAAIFCQEKLALLYFHIREITDIVFTVHDGYAVYVSRENIKKVLKLGFEILTQESGFCPGLKMNVSVKYGRDLNNLKLIKG